MELEEKDFNKSSIKLKYDKTLIVLFYNDNTDSNKMYRRVINASKMLADNVLAVCNLGKNKSVASKLVELNYKINDPLQWCSLKSVPFILIYRDHYPIAFYEGCCLMENILDYALIVISNSSEEESDSDGTINFDIKEEWKIPNICHPIISSV